MGWMLGHFGHYVCSLNKVLITILAETWNLLVGKLEKC